MKVFTLLQFWDYEGSDVLGVFESLEQLEKYYYNNKTYGDYVGYIESELGQPIGSDPVVLPKRVL